MMEDEGLLVAALAVRVLATALFVFAISWSVARAPKRMSAIAISLPVVIGPGFLILGLEQDVRFLADALDDALGALAATVAFAASAASLAGRCGAAILLCASLAMWLVAAAVAAQTTGLTANGLVFLGAYIGGLLFLSRGVGNAARHATSAVGWSLRAGVVRALLAGLLVGAVTLAADRLGPTLSATLIALPVGMIFVAQGTLRTSGAREMRRIMVAAARGTAALAVFLLVLRAASAFGLSITWAMAPATVASVTCALWLARWERPNLAAH